MGIYILIVDYLGRSFELSNSLTPRSTGSPGFIACANVTETFATTRYSESYRTRRPHDRVCPQETSSTNSYTSATLVINSAPDCSHKK